MTIKPVETASQPKYPDKYSSEALRIVRAAQPRRWIGAPLATGVLAAAVALGLSGCGDSLMSGIGPGTGADPVATTPGEVPTLPDYITLGEVAAASTPMPTIPPDFPVPGMPIPSENFITQAPAPFQFGYIPLFEFGEGSGSIGCIAVTGPVFMSEDEAFAILSAVFEQSGLTLDRECDSLPSVSRPVTDYDWRGKNMPTVNESLSCDGRLEIMDGLPMIFVSMQDFENWKGELSPHMTVYSINIKAAAHTLAENNPGLLVFYDPMASSDDERLWDLERNEDESDEAYYSRWEAMLDEMYLQAQVESERLLRAQAGAFLQWLRAEGIIGSK